jgi:hypothetical protein
MACCWRAERPMLPAAAVDGTAGIGETERSVWGRHQ